jgi:O-antigen/teichoic acid export membrane protein
MRISIKVKNSALNMVGGALPGLIGLVALPEILAEHGDVFLGIYMLQIALLFVLSLTDLGVSRAMMLVKFDEQVNPGAMIGPPFAVAKTLVFKLSIWSALVVGLINVLFLSQSNQNDIAVANFALIMAGLISLNTLPHRGFLELEGRFLLLNVIRGLSACVIYIAPLMFDKNTSDLFLKTALVILCARIVTYQAYRVVTLGQSKIYSSDMILELKGVMFSRAKWVGLTNILSLGLTFVDRYIVAVVVSVGAVASYTLATELSTKIWLITGAVMSAVNPGIASNYFSKLNPGDSMIRIEKWIVYFSVIFPVILFILNSQMLVELWLRDSLAASVGYIAVILLVGISVNSLAQLNFTLLQLAGREKVGAYLQIYGFFGLVVMASILGFTYGAVGVACAFSIRLILDALAVSYLVSLEKSIKKPISIYELMFVVFSLIILVVTL